MSALVSGFYGKLPKYGDFVKSRLPLNFVKCWDQWLDQGLGDQAFRDLWDRSSGAAPSWLFYLSKGVVDGHCWHGALVPSADLYGRVFPLTLALRTSSRAPAALATPMHEQLTELVEGLCLDEVNTYNLDVMMMNFGSGVIARRKGLAERYRALSERLSPYSVWSPVKTAATLNRHEGAHLPEAKFLTEKFENFA